MMDSISRVVYTVRPVNSSSGNKVTALKPICCSRLSSDGSGRQAFPYSTGTGTSDEPFEQHRSRTEIGGCCNVMRTIRVFLDYYGLLQSGETKMIWGMNLTI